LPENRTNTRSKPVLLTDVEQDNEERIMTGITELDRVLGGGIMRGSITLVGGDPGIGKSTLMLQMCARLGAAQPLYVTGEESLQQIKSRASRLSLDFTGLRVLAETNADEIVEAMRSRLRDQRSWSILSIRSCNLRESVFTRIAFCGRQKTATVRRTKLAFLR
jgi:DNA repair protein RadA/Sms